jgi:hypothetical protein
MMVKELRISNGSFRNFGQRGIAIFFLNSTGLAAGGRFGGGDGQAGAIA